MKRGFRQCVCVCGGEEDENETQESVSTQRQVYKRRRWCFWLGGVEEKWVSKHVNFFSECKNEAQGWRLGGWRKFSFET